VNKKLGKRSKKEKKMNFFIEKKRKEVI